MIPALLHLLVLLVVLLVAWWVLQVVMTHLGMPAVSVQVLGAIFALIFLLYMLQVLGFAPGRGP